MLNLNIDVLLHIGSFLGPRDALALSQVNCDLRAASDSLLKNQYEKTFGAITTIEPLNTPTLKRLLSCAQIQPVASIHRIYKMPESPSKRSVWLLGQENDLDRRVKANYSSQINLLENSQATSIMQLKNKMMAFWHTDRQIKNYAQFKARARAQAISDHSRELFGCAHFVDEPSIFLNSQRSFEIRSSQTCAKIGQFHLNGQDYDVAAFHNLSDERNLERYVTYHDHDGTQGQFRSLSGGKTYIGIFEKNQSHFSYSSSCNHFEVLLKEERVDKTQHDYQDLSSENALAVAISNSHYHLLIDNDIKFYESWVRNPQGSDKLLDQKLIQIMIELTIQNEQSTKVRVHSRGSDLALFMAGGFASIYPRQSTTSMLEILQSFRAKEKNKLYPSYLDYGSMELNFTTERLHEKNVYFKKNWIPESWFSIIQRDPILNPKAATLPEYWVKKT